MAAAVPKHPAQPACASILRRGFAISAARADLGTHANDVPALPADLRHECVPATPASLHEIKSDGYRLIVQCEGKTVRLFSRNGNDWSGRYPWIVEAALKNERSQFVIDGEAVRRHRRLQRAALAQAQSRSSALRLRHSRARWRGSYLPARKSSATEHFPTAASASTSATLPVLGEGSWRGGGRRCSGAS